MPKKPKQDKLVIIGIRSGCAEVDQLPAGVELEIRDYDLQDEDHPDAKKDADGDLYQEMIFDEPTE